jgi:hypothetical protein
VTVRESKANAVRRSTAAAAASSAGVFTRWRRVMLAHVDGRGLSGWPLGGVVRREGQSFRVTHHQGIPPAPGQLDWSFDVWGVHLR